MNIDTHFLLFILAMKKHTLKDYSGQNLFQCSYGDLWKTLNLSFNWEHWNMIYCSLLFWKSQKNCYCHSKYWLRAIQCHLKIHFLLLSCWWGVLCWASSQAMTPKNHIMLFFQTNTQFVFIHVSCKSCCNISLHKFKTPAYQISWWFNLVTPQVNTELGKTFFHYYSHMNYK